MLERGVERFQDPALGLRLGNVMTFGTGGIFDYVVRSARTVRESLAAAARYGRLISDPFRVSIETQNRRLVVHLHDEAVSWPRSAGDFTLSAFYRLHLEDQVPPEHVECWFPYPAPRDTSLHDRFFRGVPLRFGAPFYGFACDVSHADAPMPGADSALQALLRARADSLLTELASSHSLTIVVRRILQRSIPSGAASAEGVARVLGISRRTLTRRLERERTTFHAELDAARRKLATEHVRDCQTPLAEIALLAGFSHVESFHRAFKRWTGKTPLEYRKSSDA